MARSYVIISCLTVAQLADKVEEAMSVGYVPQGGPFVWTRIGTMLEMRDEWYAQAMVLSEAKQQALAQAAVRNMGPI